MTESSQLTAYQRFVVFAAWLGLAFDLLDALLFTVVAPVAIPRLLGGATGNAVNVWTGLLTSLMLLGWAVGGLVFGRLGDRIGRSRVVLVTMLVYALGTGACAFAPNILVLALFRFVAAIGIGGEWAAGATLVAESVPENRRVGMGSVLASAGIAGSIAAIVINQVVTSALADRPDLAWRVVMLVGALPAVAVIVIRRRLKEPETWARTDAANHQLPLGRIFDPRLRQRTIGGLVIAIVVYVTLWTMLAFLPAVAAFTAALTSKLPPGSAEFATVRAKMIGRFLLASNVGNLIGTFLAAPFARRLGRRPLFLTGFAVLSAMLFVAFHFDWSVGTRILLVGITSIPLNALVATLVFYLTELFPMRLRSTGASFCANVGRVATIFGPLSIGMLSARFAPVTVLSFAAVFPLAGFVLVLLGLGVETKGESLATTDRILG